MNTHTMPLLHSSDRWKKTYPGAVVGLLAMSQVSNPEEHPALKQRKEALQAELRQGYAGFDRAGLRALPILQAYHTYYKRFDKTYHVQLQLESLVFKGKDIPNVSTLVECMFMAELSGLLLTAGHDWDHLHLPLRLDVADGTEHFIQYNGQEQVLKSGDMYIADQEGVISTVIYGPDQRTRILPETQRVVFITYAPPGIGETPVREHLREIAGYVNLVTPEARVDEMEVKAG